MFAAPDLSTNGKIAYAAVTYICFGMLITALEVPYNAILPTMSRNEMEKNDVISLATFIAAIAVLLAASFTADWVNILGGDDPSKGYMILVGIAGVLMVVGWRSQNAKRNTRWKRQKRKRHDFRHRRFFLINWVWQRPTRFWPECCP